MSGTRRGAVAAFSATILAILALAAGGGIPALANPAKVQAAPATAPAAPSAPGSVTLKETVPGTAPFAVTKATELRWDFTVSPASASGNGTLMLTRDDGIVTQWPVTRATGALTAKVPGGTLEPGYYDVTAAFPGADDWTGSVIVVDGTVDQNRTRRFGVDAGLSWHGTTGQPPSAAQLRYEAEAMETIGLGSVRDRYGLESVTADPSTCTEESLCIQQVAQILSEEAGLDVVTVSNSGVPRATNTAAYDLNAAFTAGREFAKRMSPYVTSIEVANEPIYGFFNGYPFQYASVLKAYTAGVKSVEPRMRVLTSSYTAVNIEGWLQDWRWGALYEQETLANNTAGSFDTRNEHWYPDVPIWGKSIAFDMNTLAGGVPRMDVDTKRALDTAGGAGDKGVWVTELGRPLYPTSQNFDLAYEEQVQAGHVVESYTAALSGGAEKAFAFYWQTLLENCPSVLECTAVWGLTRNAKSDKYQDGRSQVVSPRPALASTAALIRHIQDKEVLKVETNTNKNNPAQVYGTTVYFAGGTAVTWDRSKTLANFGPGAKAKNIYGRAVSELTSPETTWQFHQPYLLSGVTVPGTATPVTVPGADSSADQSVSPTAAALRLGAGGLQINGQEPRPRKVYKNPVTTFEDRDSTIGVKVGDVLVLDVQAHAGATNADVSANTDFQCQAGPGLVVDSASGPASGVYRCQFRVTSPVPARQQVFNNGIYTWNVPGHVTVTGQWTDGSGKTHKDQVRVGLTYRAPGEFKIVGQAYEGQAVSVSTDIKGIAQYRWYYMDGDAADRPDRTGPSYTISNADFNDLEGRRVTVLAYDAAGSVLAQAWFLPTRQRIKGWISGSDLIPDPNIDGRIIVRSAWVFDWAALTGTSRMVMTVGAPCDTAASEQKYGFNDPYKATRDWSVAGEYYSGVTGGTYWFDGLTINVTQRGDQNVYLYGVPSNWTGGCQGLVLLDGSGKGKSLNLGKVAAPVTHQITFNAQGGTTPTPITITHGLPAGPLPTPTRTGYI
ncbi:MAG: hypothetical protein LBJ02_10060, partial [Bifidobacteriaceae bacterium]|nr:hypothetical protein [Bifidobacteriaceae bacterium]